MRETSHERYLTRWCKPRGILCVKFVVKADKGWPDRVVLIPGLGYPLFIEMKRPKKEGSVVARCQQRKINWLVANGYCAAVCHTGKEAVAFVKLFWSDR